MTARQSPISEGVTVEEVTWSSTGRCSSGTFKTDLTFSGQMPTDILSAADPVAWYLHRHHSSSARGKWSATSHRTGLPHREANETREFPLDLWHSSPITYDSPPLVEVAMSVQFEPPRGLNLAHLGAFWAGQRSTFPVVRSAEPIPSTNEVFGDHVQWLPPALLLALTNAPDCRLQMASSDDQWMCQVQRDRLVVNWRKRNEQYPRFSATWSRFIDAWSDWRKFVSELNLAPPIPRQWELTYVNRIPKDDLWDAPSDWPKIFPGIWGGNFANIEGASLKGLQGQWVWESSNPVARLYVEPKPGRTHDNPSQPVLLLNLTARGLIDINESKDRTNDAGEIEAIKSGMSCGHGLIVSTFDKLASADAKKTWGRHATPS